jgi:AraC-like DNA-binding protein
MNTAKDIELLALCKQIESLILAKPCIALRELSSSIGVNRQKIEYAIRMQYNFNFRQLKKYALMNQVRELLFANAPHLFIKEIAAVVGMTPNALSRFVKSMTGYTASEIRNHSPLILQEVEVFSKNQTANCRQSWRGL